MAKEDKDDRQPAGSTKITIYLQPPVYRWLKTIQQRRGGEAAGSKLPSIITEKLHARMLDEQKKG